MRSARRNDPCPCGSGVKYKKCCLDRGSAGSVPKLPGHFESYFGIEVWGPGHDAVNTFRVGVHKHLLEAFPTGEYRDVETIQQIIRHTFSYAQQVIDSELPRLAQWGPLDFLLMQLERWGQIYLKVQQRFIQANTAVSSPLRETATRTRRALKYLVEMLCYLRPHRGWPAMSSQDMFSSLQRVMIASELLYTLSMMSDQTYRLFPTETIARVYPLGADSYLDLHVTQDAQRVVNGHISDMIAYKQLSEGKYKDLIESQDSDDVGRFTRRLDPVFKAEFGFSVTEMIDVVKYLRDYSVPGENMLCPFAERRELLTRIQQVFGLTEESADRLLKAFTLEPKDFGTDPPAIWKIKREQRLMRRPFVQVVHADGPHLAWYPTSIAESLMMLTSDFPKRRVPLELLTPAIKKASEQLHKDENDGFETMSYQGLAQRGYRGRIGVKGRSLKLPSGDRLSIPSSVGEIDILALNEQERLLLVGECKNLSFAAEPSQYYEDIQDFVGTTRPDNAYSAKFQKKLAWVSKNAAAIVTALLNRPEDVSEWRIAPVMVTKYPTMASYFISQFPCVSLPLLLRELDEGGHWPYSTMGLCPGAPQEQPSMRE